MIRSTVITLAIVGIFVAIPNILFHHLTQTQEVCIGLPIGMVAALFGIWFYDEHTNGGTW